MTPAAPHTYTAPNTPPRLNPRSIPTRPTPRTRPHRATRPPMRRCPNQRHIRARPPTQIMHRIRRHPPATPTTGAPGPKLLTTRTNRWDIPRMSTRTSGGPPGVPGLLDHETQIRPRAHKNHPTSRKRSGTPTSTTATEPPQHRHAKTASIRERYGPRTSPWMCKFQPAAVSNRHIHTPVARSTLMAGAHEATPHRPEPTMPPPNTQQPVCKSHSAQTSLNRLLARAQTVIATASYPSRFCFC